MRRRPPQQRLTFLAGLRRLERAFFVTPIPCSDCRPRGEGAHRTDVALWRVDCVHFPPARSRWRACKSSACPRLNEARRCTGRKIQSVRRGESRSLEKSQLANHQLVRSKHLGLILRREMTHLHRAQIIGNACPNLALAGQQSVTGRGVDGAVNCVWQRLVRTLTAPTDGQYEPSCSRSQGQC